ncbi:MAG: hypothetical protein E7049_06560 [Lentisphaerae bacterium]|nr:hypothetical protein [Lentisphaerota bacterium]
MDARQLLPYMVPDRVHTVIELIMNSKAIVTLGCALYAVLCNAEMEYATPESQGVDSQAIIGWIDACEKTFDGGKEGSVHGFVIVRHGKTIAEGSWKPFDTLNEPHMLYSHSKSFTSTAVGFLADDGKIDIDERIADIFPEELPANPSDNLRQLRVRDLLTMNVGKKDHLLRDDGDWVGEFLSKDFVKTPGTCFRYDSDATYMLAAIVEKRTGRKLMDFLKERMFDKIGITSAWSTTSPQGIACGGWGMNMTTRELARFGQLYLQHGTWGAERVLSPDWVALATTRHTWSGWGNVGVKALGEGTDWEQGYGFQFWRCRHGAYRADGAAGQLTVVMPECDMVVSVNAGLSDMQKELSLVWEHLLPSVKSNDAPIPENPVALAALRAKIASLEIKLPGVNYERRPGACDDRGPELHSFTFKDNPRGFKSFSYQLGDDNVYACMIETRAGKQHFAAGTARSRLGLWQRGLIRVDPEAYEHPGAYVGEHKIASTCWYGADGAFHLKVYFTGDTGYLELTDKNGNLSGEFWAMNGCLLESGGEEGLLRRAKETLKIDTVSGANVQWAPLRGVEPSATGVFRGVWNWDSAFHAMAIVRWDPDLAREQFLIMEKFQGEDGMLPDVVFEDPAEGVFRGCTKPPVWGWAVWAMDRAAPDDAFLGKAYESLKRYEKFWRTKRFSQDERMFHYDGNSDNPALRRQYCGWESGWDDSPRWDGNPAKVLPIDLNCWMVLYYRSLRDIAARLRLGAESELWEKEAVDLASRVEGRLWDDVDGCYYDWDMEKRGFSRVLSPASFMPLFIGTASNARAAAMARQAKRLEPGWPTVSYDHPEYKPDVYWRGRTWLNVAYFALKGLKFYGHEETANAGRATLLHWVDSYKPSIHENYNSRTGEPLGTCDFGWSAVFTLKFITDWTMPREAELPCGKESANHIYKE